MFCLSVFGSMRFEMVSALFNDVAIFGSVNKTKHRNMICNLTIFSSQQMTLQCVRQASIESIDNVSIASGVLSLNQVIILYRRSQIIQRLYNRSLQHWTKLGCVKISAGTQRKMPLKTKPLRSVVIRPRVLLTWTRDFMNINKVIMQQHIFHFYICQYSGSIANLHSFVAMAAYFL